MGTVAIAATIFKTISRLMKLKTDPNAAALQAEINELIALLQPTLPAKPGGGEWTDDDVHAAAARAHALGDEIVSLAQLTGA